MKKRNTIPVVILLCAVLNSSAQTTDSIKKTLHFKSGITVTSKGISLIPSFTLGRPAAIFDLSLARNRLYFEPQLRFDAEGKPWSFIFWWRFKIKSNGKFRLGAGAHPALVFRNVTTLINGKNSTIMQSQRYAAAELQPNYFVSTHTSIGVYYLYSHGIDGGTVRNTHFVTLNSNFSNIGLYKGYFARFNPQFYWLRQDGKNGYYFTSTLTVGKKGFPLTVQSIINKPLHTNIAAGKNFVWNTSIIYSFSRNYAPHQ